MFRLLLVSFIFVTACNSGSGGTNPMGPSENNEDTSGNGNGSQPTVIYKWGQLKCQTLGNCDNFVLNLSKKYWVNIFTKLDTTYLSWIDIGSATNKNRRFLCGAKFHHILNDIGPSYINDLSDSDKLNMMKFLSYVFDLDACQAKNDLSKKMDEFVNLK